MQVDDLLLVALRIVEGHQALGEEALDPRMVQEYVALGVAQKIGVIGFNSPQIETQIIAVAVALVVVGVRVGVGLEVPDSETLVEHLAEGDLFEIEEAHADIVDQNAVSFCAVLDHQIRLAPPEELLDAADEVLAVVELLDPDLGEVCFRDFFQVGAVEVVVGEGLHRRGQVNIEQPLDHVLVLPQRGVRVAPLRGDHSQRRMVVRMRLHFASKSLVRLVRGNALHGAPTLAARREPALEPRPRGLALDLGEVLLARGVVMLLLDELGRVLGSLREGAIWECLLAHLILFSS